MLLESITAYKKGRLPAEKICHREFGHADRNLHCLQEFSSHGIYASAAPAFLSCS